MDSTFALDDAIIAVDVGSSSTKCVAFRCCWPCEELCRSFVQNSAQLAEIDGDHHDGDPVENDDAHEANVLAARAEKAVKECVDKLREKGIRARAVSVTSFAMNLIPLDEFGHPVSKMLFYGANGEDVAKESKHLRGEMDEREMRCRTGTAAFHGSYALAQLLALEKSRVKKLVTISAFLLARWTNARADLIGLSEASWTGMVNIHTMEWDSKALELLPRNVIEMLPNVVKSKEFLRLNVKPRDSAVEALGISEDCKFVLGIADGAAANIGSMCVSEDKIAVTVGTSAAARVLLRREVVGLRAGEGEMGDGKMNFPPPGLWCYCIDEEHVLLGGALTDGGSVYEWCQKTFKLSKAEEEEAIAMTPGSHGLVVLPFLRGERSLGWHDEATLSIHKASALTSSSAILRACMEAVGYRLALIVRAILAVIDPEGTKRVKIISSGSALSHSPILQHAIADATNLPLLTSNWAAEEATSRGCALFALFSPSSLLTLAENDGRVMSHVSLANPNPEHAKVYSSEGQKEANELYSMLYPRSNVG